MKLENYQCYENNNVINKAVLKGYPVFADLFHHARHARFIPASQPFACAG